MREHHHSPSLLPYLTLDKGDVGLKIALVNEDPSALTRCSFPFLLVDDADPLTRLIKATFITDSGNRIMDVFLLVQRDAYSFAANELVPLNNADVEAFWHQTHQVHCHDRGVTPPITLQHQIDHQGKLAPLQSLFFCKSTKTYFHPPCPLCGMPLQLCSDNILLDSLGLPQYTLSLSRYLFCPTCFSTDRGKDVYAHHCNAHDPPLVQDCADLIRAFGQLVWETNESSGLPCVACPQNEQCLSPAGTSAPPIVAFSFYPFYMLIYEAMSLNGLDFLAMVAGASTEEMASRLTKMGQPVRGFIARSFKPGRGTPRPFIFNDDARLFLEVLYLKLSFLGQIVTELFPDSGKEQPDPLLYLDRIWVKLSDRAGLLPYLWNFELNHIGLVRDPPYFPAHPQMPPAYALHLLGVIWFSALLTNSQQEGLQVQRAIERVRDRVFRNRSIILDDLMLEPAFLPENVFWDPVPFELAEAWGSLWGEVLSLGWSLFQASVQGGSGRSRGELIQTIDQLRAKIKGEMFPEYAAGKDAVRSSEAEAIHGVLARIGTRWRHTAAMHPEAWEETVVLPSDDHLEATLPPGLESTSQDGSETVVLTPPGAPQAIASAFDEEIFQETVILSGKGIKTVTAEGTKGAVETPEELAETVNLMPSPKPDDRDPPAGGLGAATQGEIGEGQILPETVILSPASKLQAPPRSYPDQVASQYDREQPATPLEESEPGQDATAKKPKPGEEDDLLSATIILTPIRDRDRK